MRTLAAFLGCALLAGAARADQGGVPPARQAVLEQHMASWSAVKTRAGQYGDNILRGAFGNPLVDYPRCKTQVQSGSRMAQITEKKIVAWRTDALLALSADLSSAKISSIQQAACADAVDKTYQLKLLYLYGTVYPQLLNDSVRVSGRSIGAQYAGPNWQLEASEQEVSALVQSYGAKCPAEPALFR